MCQEDVGGLYARDERFWMMNDIIAKKRYVMRAATIFFAHKRMKQRIVHVIVEIYLNLSNEFLIIS